MRLQWWFQQEQDAEHLIFMNPNLQHLHPKWLYDSAGLQLGTVKALYAL